jgi:hypothetical protein
MSYYYLINTCKIGKCGQEELFVTEVEKSFIIFCKSSSKLLSNSADEGVDDCKTGKSADDPNLHGGRDSLKSFCMVER